ncbi:hypothetical protein OEV98_15095 [Caldibacillus lycopersici]|uniref:Uncharacterized protein n=1 Tax=Perspicuibacillus lycopersici TaxID=1325689 RepID=A0AAE3IWV4_9BACI|nr:hypothetical protein [Perspicuibacillus lycopersici]MCU9614869.1 hypothetical protein [Perspicuibacillus lycopersici]
MGLYDEFLLRKKNGETLHLEQLTPDLLWKLFIEEEIPNNRIANLFDVKPSKIAYLRKKHGITIRHSILEEFMDEIPAELNETAKNELLQEDNVTKIAKAITHFAFRNGPIEAIHADRSKNITDADMKILNKFMVNRLAYIILLIKENRWYEVKFIVNQLDKMFGNNWDEAVPDDGGMEALLKEDIKKAWDRL